MKTAVFIPDPIFTEAEKVAQSRGISRSQLYAEALQKLLDEEITRRLNQIYGSMDQSTDAVLAQMQALSIEPEIWEEAPKRATPAVAREKAPTPAVAREEAPKRATTEPAVAGEEASKQVSPFPKSKKVISKTKEQRRAKG